ncbi:MAG: hypothetical protein QF464_21710, partial [Myxococcota bacterium]|nr:hypothetical protein [Myxococcota bacterium]
MLRTHIHSTGLTPRHRRPLGGRCTLALAVALGLGTACSGSGVGGPENGIVDAGAATDTDTVTDPFSDAAINTDTASGGTDGSPTDASPDTPVIVAHGFGAPCETGDDCYSGLCVEHMGDTVCTKGCDGDCPTGWACEQVTGAGGDP